MRKLQYKNSKIKKPIIDKHVKMEKRKNEKCKIEKWKNGKTSKTQK